VKSAKLKDVCEVIMGQAPPGDTYNTESKGIPLIAGTADFGEINPSPIKFTTQPTRISEPNDIILGIRASIGDMNWADNNYCLGRGVAGLRVKDNFLYDRYLWYWLSKSIHLLLRDAHGSTFKQVNRESIENLEIPLPPLSEQKRIAAILDKADSIRQKRKKAIELTEELLRSVFLDMFGDPVTNPKGWEKATMANVIKSIDYGTSQKANSNKIGIPIIRMNNITNKGEIDLADIKWCDIPQKDMDKYTVKKGDLLFNRTNSPELVGKTAVWDLDEQYAFAGYLIRIRFNERLALPHYISAYLNSAYGKCLLFTKAKPAINMSNISASEFKNLPILIPKLKDQMKYTNTVRIIRNRLLDLSNYTSNSNELFSYLIQNIFIGHEGN
jgi:type I restriction enzyme S subunit